LSQSIRPPKWIQNKKPPEESGGAAHVRAEIGPQEKNETTPKRHGSKLEGNYSSVNFTACSYVSRSSASGDRRTAKCSEAIIADISMTDLQHCAAGLKAGSDPAGWAQSSNCVLWQEKSRERDLQGGRGGRASDDF